KRSVGGAISVTRSRTSFLLVSGASVISHGFSRVVQAYAVLPSISIIHSLQALALIQEKRIASVGSRWIRIHRRPSSTDWRGSNGTEWACQLPAFASVPRQIRSVAHSVMARLSRRHAGTSSTIRCAHLAARQTD